jgi:hypothetical protein
MHLRRIVKYNVRAAWAPYFHEVLLGRMLSHMKNNEAAWRERVQAWRASGQTAREFTEGRDFSMSGLRYWASRVGGSSAPNGVTLARIVRPEEDRKRDGGVFVEPSPVGPRVVVRQGFDPALLREVVVALGTREP